VAWSALIPDDDGGVERPPYFGVERQQLDWQGGNLLPTSRAQGYRPVVRPVQTPVRVEPDKEDNILISRVEYRAGNSLVPIV
jgi:hypothetical protein